MIAGARVEVAPFKEDPMDFVLWKPSSEDLPGWQSPWGRGRPGWHIECSAMSHELLGESFDIHGGGIDLQFPHHENEIAQSMCAHPKGDFAKVWMHNEMLQVEGKKMSKSLGNFFTVRDLLNEYSKTHAIKNVGPAIRLRFLETHYRSPVDFGRSYIDAAATKLGQWSKWLDEATFGERPANISLPTAFLNALADDLNTPLAIFLVDRLVEELRRPFPNQSMIDARADRDELTAWQAIAAIEFLGFDMDDIRQLQHQAWSARLKSRELSRDPEIALLVTFLLEQRALARKAKQFDRADALRDGFAEAGVTIKDTPHGAEWELTADFDLAKLEALK
jgi:cysteinyl-tRNA synthetase